MCVSVVGKYVTCVDGWMGWDEVVVSLAANGQANAVLHGIRSFPWPLLCTYIHTRNALYLPPGSRCGVVVTGSEMPSQPRGVVVAGAPARTPPRRHSAATLPAAQWPVSFYLPAGAAPGRAGWDG